MDRVLRKYLEDLEARIDPQQEARLLQEWIDFTEDRFEGVIFSPCRDSLSAPRCRWPVVSINSGLEDYDMMALYQYGLCSDNLAAGSGLLLNVRCNYGTSIIPLLFGVEPFVMDEELNTLPTSRPLSGIDAVKRVVDAGVPALQNGYGRKVFEMGERYLDIAREYPKIGSCVHIYHPDLQGPMDICEVVWGSTIFYALYDQPELVKAFLEIVTKTYVQFMRAWQELVPFREGGNAHWGLLHKGNIMLRDDSAMNLSTDMFDEFIRPYDQRLLDEFDGGAIHFCGKGDHYSARMSEMDGLYAIAMSQPECNDMEIIYANTVDKGLKLIGLSQAAADEAVAYGRDLHGQVHTSPSLKIARDDSSSIGR